ncbi:MAG: hypothetical protein WBV62_14360 [Roseobacter sp.]
MRVFLTEYEAALARPIKEHLEEDNHLVECFGSWNGVALIGVEAFLVAVN